MVKALKKGAAKMARQRINLFQYYFSQVLVIILLFDCGTAHLRLTYPLGRTYDLDFLDNVRTSLPCGMSPGKYFGNFNANAYTVYSLRSLFNSNNAGI